MSVGIPKADVNARIGASVLIGVEPVGQITALIRGEDQWELADPGSGPPDLQPAV